MTTAATEAASQQLASIAAAARRGLYSEATQQTLAAIAAAPEPEARAHLVLAFADLAYRLRPTRGDALHHPFADLHGLLQQSESESAGNAALHARLLAARARMAAWLDPAGGVALARKAVAAADASGDAAARYGARWALHHALEEPDSFQERSQVSASMLGIARESQDLEHLTVAHWRCLIDAWGAADSAGYDHHMARFLKSAESLNDHHWRTMATSARAARALHEGLYDEARDASREALESGIPAAVNAASTQMMVAYVDQARARDLDPAVLAIAVANRLLYPPERVGFASYLMSAGRTTEARAEHEAVNIEDLPRDSSFLTAMCLRADLVTHLTPDESLMAEVWDRLEPYAGRYALFGDAVCCFGPVDLFLGCIAVQRGDMEATRRVMEGAYLTAARMRGRPWLARMGRDLAAAFDPASEGHGAEWARETLAIAEELGMQQVAASARELLRAGATPEPAAKRPPQERLGKHLTPRESEILALLARGRTASAIAEKLILSTRTVQKHIEHIYEKLGVQSRNELVAHAHRAGLLSDDEA